MADHDPLDLEGQEQDERKSQDKRVLARQVEAEDMAWLMDNKRGRRIVWRLLERAGVYRSSFNQSSNLTAFNEGQRNLGLMLQAQIAALPENYVSMLRENQK